MQIVCKILKLITQIVLDTRRKKTDNTFPVKIRVTFLSQQKNYPTAVLILVKRDMMP